MNERQQTKLFTGANETELYTTFKTWLDTAEPIPIVNKWFIDLANLRIIVIYMEKVLPVV